MCIVSTFPFLWLHPQHAEVLGLGTEPALHHPPEPQQWQHQILNLLIHKRTPTIFFFFLLLRAKKLHLWHMEVPRLGVESALQLLAYIPLPQQCRIWATSGTCTAAHSNARSLTHKARQGIEPTSSWILVAFVTAESQWELYKLFLWTVKWWM